MADQRDMSLSGFATKILTTFTKVAPIVIDAPPGYADLQRVRMSRVAIDALRSVEVLARLVEPEQKKRPLKAERKNDDCNDTTSD